jgi:hypothetical protein
MLYYLNSKEYKKKIAIKAIVGTHFASTTMFDVVELQKRLNLNDLVDFL